MSTVSGVIPRTKSKVNADEVLKVVDVVEDDLDEVEGDDEVVDGLEVLDVVLVVR
jgi:hypothetical protein